MFGDLGCREYWLDDPADEAPVLCDEYDTEIYDGEEYYDIDGVIVSPDNIERFVSDNYELKTAKREPRTW